ncbi:MAG: hypothetical protein LBI90_03105 [Treponema sp.]|nr:hypothetical protein [Treponema sp.]
MFRRLNHGYYLRLFARAQPDLNWDNPAVREGSVCLC